jgi:hypothetical protein
LETLHPLNTGDGFDVVGLGEHVDGLAADAFIESTFAEKLSVARARGELVITIY